MHQRNIKISKGNHTELTQWNSDPIIETKYNLQKAREDVNSYLKWIRMLGVTLITIGSVKCLTDFAKLFIIDLIELQSNDPENPEPLDFPEAPLNIAGFLDLFISLSIIYLGIKFWKTKNDPKVETVSKLISKTIIVILSWFFMLALIYILVVYAIDKGLNNWIDQSHKRLENQRIEHYNNQPFKVENRSETQGYNNITVREDVIVTVYMLITCFFSVWCWWLGFYSWCTFIGLQRFQSKVEKLALIEEIHLSQTFELDEIRSDLDKETKTIAKLWEPYEKVL